MRVAVLGLGGVGSAAARFLAAAGMDVHGYERFELDHDRGSSYGGSRIIRRVYPDPLYAELMNAAYPLWEELELASREKLLFKCGGFFLGPIGHPEMDATDAALTEVGVPFQRWSKLEAAKQLPQFRLSDNEYGIYDSESGFLRASRCVLANATGARAMGAQFRTSTTVDALDPVPNGVRILAEGEWQRYDRVVITAGPWTAPLLAPWAHLPLTVTRQQYAHLNVSKDREFYGPDRFPVWIDMAEQFYGFPENEDHPGAKLALHLPGPVIDPNDADRTPHESENNRLREYATRRLPALGSEVRMSKVCLYTLTPDQDFIIDCLPGFPQIVYIGGLSGHGFKFTVLLGQIAARLVQDLDPGVPIQRFRANRFAQERDC